ncbi:MAG: ribose-phosphate diphosphokinase [Bacteroidetes bacterium]|nr:ribose-phosphate diphosphokinase [Bacteroidota bacterium]
MNKIVFGFPGNEFLAESIIRELQVEKGDFVYRHFPDGESYLQVKSDVKGKQAIIFCSTYKPDDKWIPLYFLAQNLRDNGIAHITLVAPYLAYMRQDKIFHSGEGISGKYFAKLISSLVDELITVEPHLHRWKALSEIYTIPCKALHPTTLIAEYILKHVENPVLIGPDIESTPWISEISRFISVPYFILEKERIGDERVKISLPEIGTYKNYNPVLVDDIISTANTMIETIGALQEAEMAFPVCIGVHAIFAGNAFMQLQHSNAKDIVTCNSIPHESNKIDVTSLILKALQ